ncbi:cold-shock protein [Paenibacillus sp. PR3]|uniref:Cold-shock protein n=1 Tax=Paenibacillus terricola TaxID=2763503 RepID=A0ABR8N5A2_9BACL|nr:cold-shock protein [Paenibacillus terricola]MBD3922726.1 cold-shock protein [Paenibacillus terricola]
MYNNSRKKTLEEIPLVPTAIWSCTDENCRGWMRDNFVFSVVPVCSLCQSEMVKGEKMLAAVTNTSPLQIKL